MAESPNKVAHGSFKKADRASDKHPLFKGQLTFSQDVKAGEKVWIAGWDRRDDDDGSIWYSIAAERAVKREARQRPAPPPPRQTASNRSDMDDEIPF